MNPIAPRLLLAGIVLALIAALAILAAEPLVHAKSSGAGSRSAEFQLLVGGLGGGASVDLASCERDFDPRLAGRCSWDDGPLLGGGCFCPRHSLSIFLTATDRGDELVDEPAE